MKDDFTHAKTSPPPQPCPTWATSHLPALAQQACWLHFWNSGGWSSWSQRHWCSSVVLFSEGIQRTALFWEPPPQDAVHWKRHRKSHRKSHSSSRMLPREHLQPHHSQLRERLSYQGPFGARPTVRSSCNKHCAAIVEIQINPNCEFKKSPVLEAVEMTLTQCASGFSVEWFSFPIFENALLVLSHSDNIGSSYPKLVPRDHANSTIFDSPKAKHFNQCGSVGHFLGNF